MHNTNLWPRFDANLYIVKGIKFSKKSYNIVKYIQYLANPAVEYIGKIIHLSNLIYQVRSIS